VNLNEAILHSVAASQDNVVTQVQFMFLSDGEYMIIDALYMELYVLISFMNLKLFFLKKKYIYIFARLRDGMSKGKT
jgi:hypothetical protein